ncbi:MAG: alpha/beta hydrolase-fold protein [Gilvibacter sp.]
MKNLTFLFLVLIVFNTAFIQAQEERYFEHTIDSKVFGEARTVRVFIPERYLENPEQEFSAVYVLDSQSDQFWEMASGNIDYLVYQSQVIPMITIGIVSESRGFDFNPKNDELSRHFKEEVFPLIKEKYRVNGHNIVIGHSWGGAYIGNTIFNEYRDLFDAYIGISPSFDAIGGVIPRQADSVLSTRPQIKKFLYATSGDMGYREEESLYGIQQMDSIFKRYPNPTLWWQHEVIENTGHWTCVIPSINNGLVALSRVYSADKKVFEDMAANEYLSIADQYPIFKKAKTKNFGFFYEPSFGYIRHVADDFRDQERYEPAKDLYLMSIARGNDDVVTYFNLAQTYENLDNAAKAKSLYDKCLILVEEQKDRRSENFYTNFKAAIVERIEALK